MIVSSDVIGMRYGSLFDATQTMVKQIADDTYEVQVVSWYDNNGIACFQDIFVHAVNDGGKVLACGSGNDNFLRACVDMSLALVLAAIEAGAFQHYVYVQRFPRKVDCFGFGVNCNFLTVY